MTKTRLERLIEKHTALVKMHARITDKRDDALRTAMRYQAKQDQTARLIARSQKRIDKERALAPINEGPPLPASKPPVRDDLEAPEFLIRKTEADHLALVEEGRRKDTEAKAKIEAELAEARREKIKSRREGANKPRPGASTAMPLTGKAALDFLRN